MLFLQHRGFRYVEALVIALIVPSAACFPVELMLSKPALAGGCSAASCRNADHPAIPEMLYIAIGILGATVMPHNLYLHSSIVQTRKYEQTTPRASARRSKFATIDSTVALMFALFINAAILIVAAATFSRHRPPGRRRDRRRLPAALAAARARPSPARSSPWRCSPSGQNSTLTGTLAGQIVMEGFLNIRLRPWLRRLITRLIAIVPAVIVIALYGERGTTDLLVLSQVILSLQLSFAVIPLVMFTSDRAQDGRVREPALDQNAARVAQLCARPTGACGGRPR